MSCLGDIIIKQILTNGNANVPYGYLYATVDITIEGADGYSIDGEITFDYVRDLNAPLSATPITNTQTINSSGTTFGVYFYYPDTEPNSIITNGYIKVRIDDCWYETTYTHILTRTAKKNTSTKSSEVIGYPVISGCTNPLYYEYNPNANIDDGSCSNLRPILGCTNPLAINYNANATQNDGSCIFSSGCTNPLADNFDEAAIIDDGSCACGDIYLQLDFFNSTGESFVLTGDCTYYLEFDIITKIDCEAFVKYFQNSDETVLDLLNKLQISLDVYSLADFSGNLYQYSGGTVDVTGSTEYINTQSEVLYNLDISTNPIGIGLIEKEDYCDTLINLISTELGYDCALFPIDRFNVSWKNYKIALNSDLLNSFSKFVLKFTEFKFGVCTYIDNVKFISICDLSQQKCILIPKTFGYELGATIDNKKSWVYSQTTQERVYTDLTQRNTAYTEPRSELTFNTKAIDLQVNTSRYIDNDVVSYFNTYESSFEDKNLKKLSIQRIEENLIDVRNRQTIRNYPYIRAIYDWYVGGAQCADSKRLDYDYGFAVLDKLNSNWSAAIRQVIPLTTIWSNNDYIIKNTVFDKNKFRYKAYSLGYGDGTCSSGSTLECRILTEKCFDGYDNIDDFLVSGDSTQVCVYTGDTSTGFCVTISEEGAFRGKLVQYNTLSYNGNEFYNVLDTWGYEGYYCVTGNPIPTPDPLIAILDYCCIDGETAKVQLNISGGVPPYTVNGNFDGEVVFNGSNISSEIIDSLGSVFSTGVISVECFGSCEFAGSGNGVYFGVEKISGTLLDDNANIKVRLFVLQSMITPYGVTLGDATIEISALNPSWHTILGGSPYQATITPTLTTIPEVPALGWYYEFTFDINSTPNTLSTFGCGFKIDLDVIGASGCYIKIIDQSTQSYGNIIKSITNVEPQVLQDINIFGDYYFVFTSKAVEWCEEPAPIDCESTNISATVTYECQKDIYDYNTGFAVVSITPMGGAEPYTFVGIQDGDVVQSESEYILEIFDANGCSSDQIYILPLCPLPNCTDLDVSISSILKLSNKSTATKADMLVDYSIIGIPSAATINSVIFDITIDAGQTYLFDPSTTNNIIIVENTDSGQINFSIADTDPIILADFDFVVTLNITIGELTCEYVATYTHAGSIPPTAPPIATIDTQSNINFV